MKTFKEISETKNYYIKDCMGISRWIKKDGKGGTCISSQNGKHELNQYKPWLPDQITYDLNEVKHEYRNL